MNWMVRQISEVETQIVSVERVKEYSELKTEVKKKLIMHLDMNF